MELGYWQIRGLGAPCRMMCAYAGLDVKEKRYGWGDAGVWFGTDKPQISAGNPLANLPYFKDGDRCVTQSNAVLKYIARKAGVAGSTESEITDIDMLLCDSYDLRDVFVNNIAYRYKGVTRTVTEYEKVKPTYLTEKAKPYFDKYDAWLKVRGADFFAGASPTVADFHIWELIDQHEIFAKDIGQPSLLESMPLLKAFYARFRALDKLTGYFASDAYTLPCNVPEFTFWSGAGSSIAPDAPK
eukprot:TRINITY_DN60012_c0_g1_i1.p1 TRINITY_DN60012_c0_g1~~TRINITY_DN60012_c0_g1_i1.p1  ORF type:complete len:242 (-),score=54.78 TRINITY_DN60012_c0_g1_i1:899-1624(-)